MNKQTFESFMAVVFVALGAHTMGCIGDTKDASKVDEAGNDEAVVETSQAILGCDEPTSYELIGTYCGWHPWCWQNNLGDMTFAKYKLGKICYYDNGVSEIIYDYTDKEVGCGCY